MTKIEGKPTERLQLGPLTARLTSSPRYSSGELHFKFEDTTARVLLDDKQIGSVTGCVGGCVELRDEASGETWTIGARELWEAFQQALAARAAIEH